MFILSKMYSRNMMTKSLLDITNTLREKAVKSTDESKHVLPLADSYLEAHDASRTGLHGKELSFREEDYDNNGGPASVIII